MQSFILCADDYGLNAGINSGILKLLAQQRLSAVSCMTNLPLWSTAAQALLPYRFDVALGIHLNLTEGQPLTRMPKLAPEDKFPSLHRLIVLAAMGNISEAEVVQEWRAQILAFHSKLGIWPMYLDGQQHVHQFPIIRQALSHLWQEIILPNEPRAYVRATYFPPWRQARSLLTLKAWIIYILGGKKFKQLLEQNNIPHNSSFSGIYSFSAHEQYQKKFKQFLREIDSEGIIMCHPGEADLDDELSSTRVEELNYFLSPAFIRDCQQAGKIRHIGR